MGSVKRARKGQGRSSGGLRVLRLDRVKLFIVNFVRKGRYRTKAGRKTTINLKN